jgi:prepilin peptidase CpaA
MHSPTLVIQGILIVTLLIAVTTDLIAHKIYNWLTFPVILLGLALNGWRDGGAGLLFALGGIGVASLALLLFLLAGAMGAGDVKLLWAVGALTGPIFTFWALLGTAIAGGALGLLYAASRGELAHTARNALVGGHVLTTLGSADSLQGMARTSRVGKMPYAPAIALGVAAVALLRHLGAL